MAEYVYGSGDSYGKYLQNNAYIRDITGQIKKSGEATRNQISATLEFGFDRVNNALDNVETSIESLHSDFSYNMGLVLDQLQIQNQLTFGVLEKLDAIHKTLETPRLTQARECYIIGCERLSKGLLDKALEAFLKAEERNDTDFFTEFQIGKLYLYGVDEDDYVIDLVKAEKHLRNAARYGKSEISVLPEFRRWTGEALLHASISCYAQANDQRINENTVKAKEFISEAFKLAQQACDIYPSLSESKYHLAKYAALLEDVETSLESLEEVVTTDVNYCLKIEFDPDFDKIRPQVFVLFERLRMKFGEIAKRRLQDYNRKYLNETVHLTHIQAEKYKEEISKLLSVAEIKINDNTLKGVFESLDLLEQIELTFSKIPQVKHPNLRCDGLYLAKIRDGKNFLRFYKDGTVLSASVISTAKPHEVIRWFNKKNDNCGKGLYSIVGSNIKFTEKSNVTIDYEGTIEKDTLRLKTYSHYNGHSSTKIYKFENVREGYEKNAKLSFLDKLRGK